jgi:prevent-host-death family protein
MERTISAFDVRRMFGKVLTEVLARGTVYVVERHGEPVAAVVPIRLYEQWRRQREAFFDAIQATAQRVNTPEEQALTLALGEQQAVRAARRRSNR